MTDTITQARIRQLLIDKDMSQNEVSRRVGQGLGLVRDILAGKTKSPRTDSLEGIARALGVSVGYLIGTSDTYLEAESSNGADAALAGQVAAGVWFELLTAPAGSIPFPVDSRYPNAPLKAWFVGNDSADVLIGPGGYVVSVAPTVALPRDGSTIVLQRTNGELTELSVRVLRRDGTAWAAESPSASSRYRPVRLEKLHATPELEIVAVVIGAVRMSI